MNLVLIISGLNLVLIIALWTEAPPVAGVLLAFWLLALGGALVYQRTRQKGWAYASMAGFVIFFPISLIAIYGVRQMMAQETEATLPAPAEALQTFRYNQRMAWAYLGLGIASFVVEIATRMWVGYSVGLAGVIGVVLVIMFFLYRKLMVLYIYPKMFTLRNSPMESPKIIYHNDILSVEQKRRRMTITLRNGHKVHLAQASFERTDWPQVMAYLKSLKRPPAA